MSLFSFLNVANILGGKEIDPEKQQELFKEVLILTLSRMTRADLNVDSGEVNTVKEVVKAEIGEDITDAEIRVSANSELFEEQPLEKYLHKISKQLDSQHRARIAKGLARVIETDSRISDAELEFFDAVAAALHIKPSELLDLK